MKKEDTIRLHLDRYLDGKSEQKRADFLAKPVAQQYAAIMAWKRRNDIREQAAITAQDLLKHIRSLQKLIPLATDLTPKDIEKLTQETSEVMSILGDYERQRAHREIEALEREQEELRNRIESLRNKFPQN